MAPYKAGETKEGACTYHGGYLGLTTLLCASLHTHIESCIMFYTVKSGRDKEAHWSCCKKQTEEQSATHELHSSTGYNNITVHVYISGFLPGKN